MMFTGNAADCGEGRAVLRKLASATNARKALPAPKNRHKHFRRGLTFVSMASGHGTSRFMTALLPAGASQLGRSGSASPAWMAGGIARRSIKCVFARCGPILKSRMRISFREAIDVVVAIHSEFTSQGPAPAQVAPTALATSAAISSRQCSIRRCNIRAAHFRDTDDLTGRATAEDGFDLP